MCVRERASIWVEWAPASTCKAFESLGAHHYLMYVYATCVYQTNKGREKRRDDVNQVCADLPVFAPSSRKSLLKVQEGNLWAHADRGTFKVSRSAALWIPKKHTIEPYVTKQCCQGVCVNKHKLYGVDGVLLQSKVWLFADTRMSKREFYKDMNGTTGFTNKSFIFLLSYIKDLLFFFDFSLLNFTLQVITTQKF